MDRLVVERVVEQAWLAVFGRPVGAEWTTERKNDTAITTERALHEHIVHLATCELSNEENSILNSNKSEHKQSAPKTPHESGVVACLTTDMQEKLSYMDPSFGPIDAAAIISEVDECTIVLQEYPKNAFLDPLDWDLKPHPAVLATVRATLLLFNVPPPPDCSDDALWRSYWGLWIVKNIDAHTSGWEWVAMNEPMGLFTKPYLLSAGYLPEIKRLLGSMPEKTILESQHSWRALPAYTALRDWVEACVAYVHLKTHLLPGFAAYDEVQSLLAPPTRTAEANVWFRLESPEGIEYYYNRLQQLITLERPSDFDGAHVTSIPRVLQELIAEILQNDHISRLELERRGHERTRRRLLAEDEWVECVDPRSKTTFYYSFAHFRTSATPPSSGVFLTQHDSVAYHAVVRLQLAYRQRRLQQKLKIKRVKRASLPTFASNTKFY